MSYPVPSNPGVRPDVSNTIFPSDNRHSSACLPNAPERKQDFNILEKLKELRDNKKYCDIILEVRGAKLEAHKNVLCAWSPYFASKLFPDDTTVIRDHVLVNYDNSEVFSDLVDFMYNGYVAPRETNFLQLLHLAVSFQIEMLKNYCEEFLRCNLHLGNFVSTYFLSRKYRLQSLEEYIVNFLQLNLSDAVKQGEFLSLTAARFNTFLSNGFMEQIKPEIKLFLIISWVGYDVQDRERYLVLLLRHIDWSTVASDFLLEISRTENFFTSHESSLYLLLQTLHSAGIALGPYSDMFPGLRQTHSHILEQVVLTGILPQEVDDYFQVTISVTNRPTRKDASINTDVNSLHFTESEPSQSKEGVEKSAVVEETEQEEHTQEQSTEILEQPSEEVPPPDEQPVPEVEPVAEAQLNEPEQEEMKQHKRKGKPKRIVTEERNVDVNEKVEKRGRRRRPTPSKKKQMPEEKEVQDEGLDKVDDMEDTNENSKEEEHIKEGVHENSVEEEGEKEAEEEEQVYSVEKDENDKNMDQDLDGQKLVKPTKLKLVRKCKKTATTGSESPLKQQTVGKTKTEANSSSMVMLCSHPGCKYKTRVQSRLIRHEKEHKDDVNFKCNICGYDTCHSRAFSLHMKEHFEGPPFNCDEPRCMYSSDKLQSLLSHRFGHADERPFGCTQCGMRFRSKNNLYAHNKLHSGKRPWDCVVCQKSFATKNTLSQHMVIHNDVRPYLCDTCGFATKYQSHLTAHKRIHTGEVYHCQFPKCNYFTPKRSMLKSHMRSHLGIRQHTCKTCGKNFIEKSHLVRHERIHTDERPYKCDFCEYSAGRSDKLKEHIAKHHTPPVEGEEPVTPKKRGKRTKSVKTNSVNAKKIAVATTPTKHVNIAPRKEKSPIDITAQMLVKWDHGGYYMQQPNGTEGEPTILIQDQQGQYNVLRDHLNAGAHVLEPSVEHLRLESRALADGQLGDPHVVGDASVSMTRELGVVGGDQNLHVGDQQTSTITVLRQALAPTMAAVNSSLPMDGVSSQVVTSGPHEVGVQPEQQTYTIIHQPPSSVALAQNAQEYGGLSAFMALF